MKTLCLLLSLVLGSLGLRASGGNEDFGALYTDDKAKTYAEQYKYIAISEMDRTGVPASIKMAQAILESGCGASELARQARNHFGIKCGGKWTGQTYYVWDDEPQKSCFRVYESVEESYIAHSDFLLDTLKRHRYGFLFTLGRTDYKAWAHGLQKAGYATSQTYAVKLIALIERLELYKLDYLTLQAVAVNEEELRRLFPELYPQPSLRPVIELGDTTAIAVFVPDPFGNVSDSVSMVLTQKVFSVNELPTVYVQVGDNTKSLARRYKVKERKLLRYNELRGHRLRPGQFVFLKRKKKSYTPEMPREHLVRSGQSLYDIAQHYGVMLKHLEKLNPQLRRKTIEPGIKVKLKP